MLSLGIHCGHESSCAIVKDGVVIAAMQQERKTRRKYDGQEFLSNRLPINEVLKVCGYSISDIDIIVTSFQAAGPGAVGFHRPLYSNSFDIFDPYAEHHYVVSHHLAHAATAAYGSGFPQAAVLISDTAGTTSQTGDDFFLKFKEFYDTYAHASVTQSVLTEMRSFYRFDRERSLKLLHRDFVLPHNQPDIFIQSEASLFDNASRYIFREEHAHGQFMALSGMASMPSALSEEDIITESDTGVFKSGWQDHLHLNSFEDQCGFARAVQRAFTSTVLKQADAATKLAQSDLLCCAGGVFLNLPANTAIANLPGVRSLYIPSAPHDAGIAIGAAYIGYFYSQTFFGTSSAFPSTPPLNSDYLGMFPEPMTEQISKDYGFSRVESLNGADVIDQLATSLIDGSVIATYVGRAEFGPRALGNRSIIAHPVSCRDMKAKINNIKSRQWWRPVAPVVRDQDLYKYFTAGPPESLFMNYNYDVHPEFLSLFKEVCHHDGTARVQTVKRDTNSWLYDLLTRIEELGHVPILANTSLNGPGQPMIESIEEVLKFVVSSEIDVLFTNGEIYGQPKSAEIVNITQASDAVLATFGPASSRKYVISNSKGSIEISGDLFEKLLYQKSVSISVSHVEVNRCLDLGILVYAE
jgi:carbamoyltransferase